MDEILLLERSRAYLDMLSKGIDPIGGEAVPEDSVLKSERLKKCFSYVCGVLDKVLSNGGEVVRLTEKRPLFLTDAQKNSVQLSIQPVNAQWILKKVNGFVPAASAKKLVSATLNKWLTDNKYLFLEKVPVQSFKRIHRPGERAEDVGILLHRTINSSTGEAKEELVFSEKAQRMILDNINDIARNGKKAAANEEEAGSQLVFET